MSFDLLPQVLGGRKWTIYLFIFSYFFKFQQRGRTSQGHMLLESEKFQTGARKRQKAEATVHENSVKSLHLFVLHKRGRGGKSLNHLPFLTAV